MLAITLKQLETFVAVARNNGFRRAAEHLNLSQSAVTGHIKSLESHLGVPLFHRTTRSVKLTAAGELLLAQAARTLSGVEEIVAHFRAEAAVQRGRVALASAPSFASSLLPGILAAFQSRYRDIHVEVRELFAGDIFEAVHSDQVDFGIGPTLGAPKDLATRTLFDDVFVALVARDHPLASRKSIRLEQLAKETLLMMPRMSEIRRQLEAAFASHALSLQPAYEMLHHQTLIAMAEAGVGVGVVPSVALRAAGVTKARVIQITHPAIRLPVGTITRHGHALSPPATALLELVTSSVV